MDKNYQHNAHAKRIILKETNKGNMKKALIGLFLFILSVSLAGSNALGAPFQFQNPSFEQVQTVSNVRVCEAVFTVLFGAECRNVERTGNQDAYIPKVTRPVSWTTPLTDGIESQQVSNTGARSIMIFSVTNTSYDEGSGSPNPQSEQCSYRSDIPFDASQCGSSNPTGQGVYNATRSERTVNGSFSQTLTITSPVISVSWWAQALDFRPVKSFHFTVPESFYGDKSGFSSIYRFKVKNSTNHVIYDLECGKKINETGFKFCDAGSNQFVKNQIDLSSLNLANGDYTFLWEAGYPEAIADSTITQPNGVYIDDVLLSSSNVVIPDTQAIDVYINNVSTLSNVLHTQISSITPLSGSCLSLNSSCLTTSNRNIKMSNGYGDFYIVNVSWTDNHGGVSAFCDPRISASNNGRIELLDASGNLIPMGASYQRFQYSGITTPADLYALSIVPKGTTTIRIRHNVSCQNGVMQQIEYYNISQPVLTARNVFPNTQFTVTENEFVNYTFPLIFYSFQYNTETRNLTYRIADWTARIGNQTDTGNIDYYIVDGSGTLLDASSDLSQVQNAFLTNKFTNFLLNSPFSAVGNTLIVNRTGQHESGGRLPNAPLFDATTRVNTESRFEIANIESFCSNICIDGDYHVRQFVGAYCSETIIPNATDLCPAPPEPPTPAESLIGQNVTDPLNIAGLNATAIRESGFGFTLIFITPLVILLLIFVGLGAFLEMKVKHAHGMIFLGVMLVGLSVLLYFQVLPLAIGIVLVIGLGLAFTYQITKAFRPSGGG